MSIVAVLSTIVVVVLAVLYLDDTSGSRLDNWATAAAMAQFPESPTSVFIDSIGEPVIAAALVLVLTLACLLLGRLRLAVVAVVGLPATVLVTSALKPVVQRTIGEGNLSYPSGHTASATALALVAILLITDVRQLGNPTRTWLVLGCTTVAGAVMALDQISLNNHYLTDTIGGFCTAVVVVPTVARLVDAVADRPTAR